MPAIDLRGLECTPLLETLDAGIAEATKFDLSLVLEGGPEGLNGTFQYRADLMSESNAQRFVRHYRQLLHELVRAPDLAISRYRMLTQAEWDTHVHIRNQTHVDYQEPFDIAQQFEAQAAAHPDRIAVCEHDRRLTYGELNSVCNRLSRTLSAKGVGPGDVVGVHVERSIDTVVAVMAILKAGAAYAPLDRSYPADGSPS